jgi:cytochrome oxidase Cu insertion factor (SCO1/SenC/PrrC family)
MVSLRLWAVILLALGSACGAGAAARPSVSINAAAPTFGTALNGPVPAEVLDARLVNGRGHGTSLGDLKGKVIVLSDFMTLCQEVCPIGTASMLQAARQIDQSALGAHVVFVSLTIDPRRDDTRHLRAYQRTFGGFSNWLVLGGTPSVVDAVWKRLGIWIHRTRNSPPYPRDWVTGQKLTSDLSHTDELIFIDADQRFRYEVDGTGTVSSARKIPTRLYHFMDALGHRNVTHPAAGDWSPAQVADVVQWLGGDSP